MFDSTLNVSIIEDSIFRGDKLANLEQLEKNLQNIPEGTDLVVLPELFSTGFILDDRKAMAELAERNTQDTISLLHTFAKRYNTAIAGSFLAHTADQIYNRAFFIEPCGDETFYDKYHLFGIGGETDIFSQGFKEAPIIRYRGWNIKLIVCYDVRFPVWCRNVNNKYDLMLVVANWPKVRSFSWKTLLTTRAIENISYVCGANRIGTDPTGLEYSGDSLILDFKGKTLAERTVSPIISATLNMRKLEGFRTNFPAWKDADSFSLNK